MLYINLKPEKIEVCTYEPNAHWAGGYPGFRSMKQLGVCLPPGRDASQSQGYPSIKFSGSHLGGETL